MTGDKIRSSAPSMILFQKVLTGVFVGAVFQRLTCRFIGHRLQTWTTRIILLHNLASHEHKNSPTGALGLIEYVVESWNSYSYSKCQHPARTTDLEKVATPWRYSS